MLEFLQNYWSILLAGVIAIVAIVALVIITRKPKDEIANQETEDKNTEETTDEETVNEQSIIEGATDTEEPTVTETEEEFEETVDETGEKAEEERVEPQKRRGRPRKNVEEVDDAETESQESVVEEVETEDQEIEDKESDEESESSEVEEPSDELESEEETEASSKAVKKTAIIYHVIYDKDLKEWLVRKNNGKRASKKAKTKEEAIIIAKQLCENNNATLRVHKKDGKFQKKSNI